ncbi:hypothetical protein QF035_011228 [Streptomyces umbrinus]|uniref:DUF4007 domain-containing protein n=1 Tax=Streptomyces umbrinus TaxID=67370 RepID=A0ABU0TCP0_9ACTN|nr:DUF4007 family protein [Streptomyces umbrinus]MDQ1033559.1 hypothetical protein [Streptomyces umbrinus]
MPTPAFPSYVAPVHARHGSYSPRYGWLLKTHLAVQDNPHVFATAHAIVELGAGKSAVASMRFWSSAFKLTDEARHGPGTPSSVTPTARGRWLLDEDGADPYLEQDGSLFLLHWWLLAPPCRVPAWFYTFCLSPFARLEPGSLREGMLRASAAADWVRLPTAATLHRDIMCMIRMYTTGSAHEQPRTTLEDLVDRPFSALAMMSVAPDGAVHLSPSAGTSAPTAVVAYACLEYASRSTPGPGSMSFGRLLHDDAGPGRVLRLQPRSLRRALQAAAVRHPQVGVADAGDGTEVLTFNCPPLALAWDVLDESYGHVRQRLGLHPQQDAYRPRPGDARPVEQLAFGEPASQDSR